MFLLHTYSLYNCAPKCGLKTLAEENHSISNLNMLSCYYDNLQGFDSVSKHRVWALVFRTCSPAFVMYGIDQWAFSHLDHEMNNHILTLHLVPTPSKIIAADLCCHLLISLIKILNPRTAV